MVSKRWIHLLCEKWIEKYIPREKCMASLGIFTWWCQLVILEMKIDYPTFTLMIDFYFLAWEFVTEAVWSRKIHVQIMRFACCLNMALTWKSLNWALICMHDVILEGVAAVTDHFADAFVRENIALVYMTLWRRNDLRKFDADTILYREIKWKKMDN